MVIATTVIVMAETTITATETISPPALGGHSAGTFGPTVVVPIGVKTAAKKPTAIKTISPSVTV